MRSRVISTNCPGHTKKIGESSGEWKLRPLLSSSLIYPLLSFESFVFFCQIKTAVVLFCMIPIAKLTKNSSTHTTMTGGFPNRPVERATRVLSFLIMAAERTTIVASKPGRPESWPLGLRTAARPTKNAGVKSNRASEKTASKAFNFQQSDSACGHILIACSSCSWSHDSL